MKVPVSPSSISRREAETVTPRVSSSSISSLRLAGSETSASLVTAARMVTVLSGPSMSLSTAVKVTVPVLAREPAAMVSTLLLLSE